MAIEGGVSIRPEKSLKDVYSQDKILQKQISFPFFDANKADH